MAAVVDFGNLQAHEGLQKLNDYMASHSYIVGYNPTQQDVTTFSKFLCAPDTAKYPHANRWYRHIASFTVAERDVWAGQKTKEAPKPAATASKKKPDTEAATASKKKADTEAKDDDFDLFGEETAEEKEAAKAMSDAAAAAKKTAKPKKKVIEKSQLVIDVKPSSIDTDMKKLEQFVREIKIEGVEWSVTSKVLPIAFGLMKLQIGCVIIDELVNTDDILAKLECIGLSEEKAAEKLRRREAGEDDEDEDEEEEPEGLVQSAEIVSFNKL